MLTGADLAADGLGDIPCVSIPSTIMGGNWFRTSFPALAVDQVRCVGQEVALVIAATRAGALDAAERVAIDYDPLPAAPTIASAIAPGAPAVWPLRPDNLCFVHELGDRSATAAAFVHAHHVTRTRIHNQRLAGNPLEPRGCIGTFDRNEGRYRLVSSTANPHRIRQLLAEQVLRVPAHRIHVIARDVGGGFGTKGGLYPEEVLVLWAAKRIGRPIKWIADRSESFLADFNGRDQLAEGEMAFDAGGRTLGFRVTTHHNLGCQVGPSGAHPPLIGARMLSGLYAIPAMHVTIHGVLTHSRTLTTYRGAGRPEATFLVERVLDQAAHEMNVDPVELRRRNLIAAMPYRTALGEWLGVDLMRVQVIQGDTDKVAYGRGSFGSRTATIGGSALSLAAADIIAKGKRIAAHLLETDADDITFAAGRFRVAGTDRGVSIQDAARAAYVWGSRLPSDLASGHGLRDAARGRSAGVRGDAPQCADSGQSARCQRRRGNRHGQSAAGHRLGDRRRAAVIRRSRPAHARDPSMRLAGDSERQAAVISSSAPSHADSS